MHRLVLLLLLLGPPLRILAPPELASVQKKLEAIDPKRFGDIATDGGSDGDRVRRYKWCSRRKPPRWLAKMPTLGCGLCVEWRGQADMVVLFPGANAELSQRFSRRRVAARSRALSGLVARLRSGRYRAGSTKVWPCRWSAAGGCRMKVSWSISWRLDLERAWTNLDRMFDGEPDRSRRAHTRCRARWFTICCSGMVRATGAADSHAHE